MIINYLIRIFLYPFLSKFAFNISGAPTKIESSPIGEDSIFCPLEGENFLLTPLPSKGRGWGGVN